MPVPVPVLGMPPLFAAPRRRGWDATPEALLGHRGPLFVPAGLGVALHRPVLAQDWAPLSLTVIAAPDAIATAPLPPPLWRLLFG